MGTALVMEHANALAQMIVSEKDKLFDERVEALVKLYRRAEFYLKQGFLESIVCEFHRKKVEMIMQAETKGEITEILKLSKPHFDGNKFVQQKIFILVLQVLLADLREYRRYLYIVRWICQHIDWKICQNAELFLKNILNHILRITQGRSYGHIKNYRWREISPFIGQILERYLA